MIKFACSNCKHRIGAPEKYAGKRIRCPKCKSPTSVPESVEKTDSPEQQLIKFRCPNCNQKIGVSKDYAGRQVKCSKCKNPLHVPSPEKEPLEKKLTTDDGGFDNMFQEDNLSDDLLAAEASAPPMEEPLKVKPSSSEPDAGKGQGIDSDSYIAGVTQTYGRSGSEPAKKKYVPLFLMGIACVSGIIVAGIIMWFSIADSNPAEDVPGEQEVTISDDGEETNVLDEIEDAGPETALFCITSKNYKEGFIDNTGKIIIKPKFETAGFLSQGFSDGLARVAIGKKICYIDRTGETQFFLDSKYGSASKFSEGLAVVGCVVGNEEKYGYIDKTGKLAIETKFSSADEFSEGRACVQVGGKAGGMMGGLYGYIDRYGEYVVEPVFDHAEHFSDGLACVKVGAKPGGFFEEFGGKVGGKYGYIDREGYWVIEPQFEWATHFSEGLAAVLVDRKAWFIDKEGYLAIEMGFDSAMPFSEGLASVTVRDKRGYIDKTGMFVIEPQFKGAANSFCEGLAAVYDGGKEKFGFIDKTGSFVIEPRFDLPGDFSNGLARVNVGRKWGYINKAGELVWKCEY